MQFSQIPIEKISEVWNNLAPFIEKALDESSRDMNLSDVYVDILSGTAQLWTVHEAYETKAVGVTKLILYPRQKVCRIVLFSSLDLNGMIDLLPMFEKWALSEGCSSIEWLGRKGFIKTMARFGYESKYVMMRKHLIKEILH